MIMFGNKNMSELVTYGNGLLYNWYAVNGDSGSGSKVFAPVGWHVPTATECDALSTYLGGNAISGGKLKSTRTSAPYFSSNVGATNESGFNAFGSGRRLSAAFVNTSTICTIITTTLSGSAPVYMVFLNTNDDYALAASMTKKDGFSVRLLKDDSNWFPGMIVTDINGNKYGTVKIGNQVWLQSNWKCTKYNDGTAIPNVEVNATWVGLTTGAYCSYNNQPIVEYTELF